MRFDWLFGWTKLACLINTAPLSFTLRIRFRSNKLYKWRKNHITYSTVHQANEVEAVQGPGQKEGDGGGGWCKLTIYTVRLRAALSPQNPAATNWINDEQKEKEKQTRAFLTSKVKKEEKSCSGQRDGGRDARDVRAHAYLPSWLLCNGERLPNALSQN